MYEKLALFHCFFPRNTLLVASQKTMSTALKTNKPHFFLLNLGIDISYGIIVFISIQIFGLPRLDRAG